MSMVHLGCSNILNLFFFMKVHFCQDWMLCVHEEENKVQLSGAETPETEKLSILEHPA